MWGESGMRLSDFSVLTFDCYGTLIDWETGIATALAPWLERAGVRVERDRLLETFAEIESAQQAATPAMRYSELLAEVHRGLAERFGLAPDADGRARSSAPRSRTGRRFPTRPRRSPTCNGTTSW